MKCLPPPHCTHPMYGSQQPINYWSIYVLYLSARSLLFSLSNLACDLLRQEPQNVVPNP